MATREVETTAREYGIQGNTKQHQIASRQSSSALTRLVSLDVLFSSTGTRLMSPPSLMHLLAPGESWSPQVSCLVQATTNPDGVSCSVGLPFVLTDSRFLPEFSIHTHSSHDGGDRDSWFLDQDYLEKKLFKGTNMQEQMERRRHTRPKLQARVIGVRFRRCCVTGVLVRMDVTRHATCSSRRRRQGGGTRRREPTRKTDETRGGMGL